RGSRLRTLRGERPPVLRPPRDGVPRVRHARSGRRSGRRRRIARHRRGRGGRRSPDRAARRTGQRTPRSERPGDAARAARGDPRSGDAPRPRRARRGRRRKRRRRRRARRCERAALRRGRAQRRRGVRRARGSPDVIDLPARTRRISGSRLLDLCRERGIASVVDPFMGIPNHLATLKRHGIVVHGGDLLEWFVRAGEGIVANDFTILRDPEVAEIVEMLPGRIYPTDLFRAWEGVFFSEEQCRYLGVWHANVHALRSDGQTGIAVLGLWHVLCHWLHKARDPDEMIDVPPSELAWHYIRETQRRVCANGR